MYFDNNALTVFQASAGISALKLSLFTRTLVFVITLLWAGFCIYGTIHHIRHGQGDLMDVSGKVLRVLFVTTLMMLIVFIPK